MQLLNWALLWIYKLLSIQVNVNEGILEGDVKVNSFGSLYFSFEGIPYAEPPVENLRFKAPEPKIPWDGVRNAKVPSSKCYQYAQHANDSVSLVGSEDCLYLNVYTPNIVSKNLYSVMVWIHGGGFISGSGDEYDPGYLIAKNVVVVTLNYRLDALGFLSLDTEDIPGNAGIKDQVAALRWVKDNISKFGGDPDSITIFGQDSGASSVSYHLVSPMTKDLFKRAILQSGALKFWSNSIIARERALALSKKIGCYSNEITNDDNEIYECFIAQPVENLIARDIDISYAEWAKASPNIYFGIVSEKQFEGNERFYFGHPFEVLRNGIHEGVQIINGFTQDEGVMYFSKGVDINQVFDQANKFEEFFVPEPYTKNVILPKQIEIGRRFRQFYMQDKIASKDTLDYMLKYFNMELIVYETLSLQKLIALKNESDNYLYKFTCESELNVLTNTTELGQLFNHRATIAHGDDIGYLFPLKSLSKEVSLEAKPSKMVDQITTLWTNFAKYGNPTPDDSLGVKWLSYTLDNQEYLNIGENLMQETHPEKADVEFWESNFKEFLPELVP